MRVKLLSTMAGPDGVNHPGDIVDLPEEEARQLIDNGQADDASGIPEPVVERAVDIPAEERETADKPPHRAGRRPRRDK